MFDAALVTRASVLIAAYRERQARLVTAESCTGGLVAALLTEVAGSSLVVERGFVTYSNEAKAEILGVDFNLISAHGAVSEPVARAMAKARSPIPAPTWRSPSRASPVRAAPPDKPVASSISASSPPAGRPGTSSAATAISAAPRSGAAPSRTPWASWRWRWRRCESAASCDVRLIHSRR